MEIANNLNRKKLSKRIALISIAIFLLDFIAARFYWYVSIWWFDMFMHFLGGFWIGLLIFWIFYTKFSFTRNILKVFLLIFIIGFAWEFFEVVFNNYIAGNTFNLLDTLSDLLFDLAGGGFSIIYFLKRIMIKKNIEI